MCSLLWLPQTHFVNVHSTVNHKTFIHSYRNLSLFHFNSSRLKWFFCSKFVLNADIEKGTQYQVLRSSDGRYYFYSRTFVWVLRKLTIISENLKKSSSHFYNKILRLMTYLSILKFPYKNKFKIKTFGKLKILLSMSWD